MKFGAQKAEPLERFAGVPQVSDAVDSAIVNCRDLTPEEEAAADAAIAAACEILRPRHLPGDGAKVHPKANLRTYSGGRVVGGTFQIHKPMEAF